MSSSQQCQSTEGRSELDGLSSCWQLIAAAADDDDDDDERWDEADCASVAAVTAVTECVKLSSCARIANWLIMLMCCFDVYVTGTVAPRLPNVHWKSLKMF